MIIRYIDYVKLLLQLSVEGDVVKVEVTVQLNDEVVNVNDDVYLTDFVTAESLHFSSQSTELTAADPKVVNIMHYYYH